MKKLFAVILAVAMVAALLCACGKDNKTDEAVTTTVEAKYDDGFAKDYASSVSTDSNGNTIYEFTDEKYDEFENAYKNSLNQSMEKEVAAEHDEVYGQFIYIKPEENSVIVGLNEGDYDEATAAKEAELIADDAFKYFQNLRQPVDNIKVVFCFANDQSVVYGTYEFSAE